MDSTKVSVGTGQSATTQESSKANEAEELGYFTRLIAEKATQWTAPTDASLDGINIKPINGTWSGLLHDMARYLIVDKAELGNNEPLINNVSNIVRQVLLAIGTVRANADQPPELNDPEFVRHITANLLKIFLDPAHDLKGFDLEADPKSQKGKELRLKLGVIFNELLKSARLDESNKEKLPYAIKQLLYPDTLAKAAQGLYRFFSSAEEGVEEKPPINREGLEKMFVDGAINMLIIQKKLAVKSQDPILNENEGVSKLADKLVRKEILKKLRGGELAFSYSFLKSKKNGNFLNAILNQILSEPEKGKADYKEIQEAWRIIEDQLKMAIKGILAVVLTPDKGQAPVDRRNTLLINILDRLSENSEALNKRVNTINGMDRKKLEHEITAVKIVKGPYAEKAKELLERKEISWESEVKDFIKEAWRDKINQKEPTHADLLKILEGWEKEKESNPRWKAVFEDKAQMLLERENLDWESEARRLLKQRDYAEAAQTVLKNELNPEKFAAFIPKFIKTQDLFEQIYEFVGETALEFHEQQQTLEVMGKEAYSFITHSSIPKLPKFVDEMMAAVTATVEDQAQKNKINLGYGKFLNEMICHLLKEEEKGFKGSESEDAKKQIKGQQFAKQEVTSLAKNVLMIAIKKAIESNTNEKCPQAEAFTNLTNNFVKNTLSGLQEIGENCNELKEKSTPEKKAAIEKLAAQLGIEVLKIESTDDKLLEQYRGLLVKSLSRELIKHLMPNDLFNSLLPPMLRKSNLWESVTDDMVAPYLEGISVTLETFQAASIADSKEAKQLKLIGENEQPHPLQPLIKQIAAKASDFVSDMKFSKLLKQEADSKLNKVNFEVLDELFGKAFKQGGQIINLIQVVLPPFIESILALKLNPKDEKQTSQDLATELIWSVLERTHACYERIDAIRENDQDLATLKNKFQEANEFNMVKIDATLEAYCDEKKIKNNPAIILEDKEFYIWVQIRQEMKGTLKELMDEMISEEMWNLYVPKQFEKLVTRDAVGDLLLDYLKEGYDHSVNMKKMVSEGKAHLPKEEVKLQAAAKQPSPARSKVEDKVQEKSLQEFIEGKVIKGLNDAAKPLVDDEISTQWMKGVLAKLLDKQKSSPNQFITKFSVNIAYAILGQLISGGISSFIKTPEVNIAEVKEGQKCSDYSQITADNIKNYLFVRPGGLKDLEIVEGLPTNFELKDGKIVFKVTIKDTKTKASREVFIDANLFVKIPDLSQITTDDVKDYLFLEIGDLKKEEIIEKLPTKLELKNGAIIFKVTVKDTKTEASREVSIDAIQFIKWKINYLANKQLVSDLMGQVSKLIPLTRKSFKNLNNLKEGQECSVFPQITTDNVKAHLSIGKNSLNDDEIVEKLPTKFELKDDEIVFKVLIKDTKTGKSREEFIGATRFVYWGVVYQGINNLISDDDWKKLIPELVRPMMTKASMAELAIPYIHAAHQIQEPLQRKAEAGMKRVEDLAAEDPELQAFIDKKVIDKIKDVLDDMAKSPKKVVKETLPGTLDIFAKAVLKKDTNPHIVKLKGVLIERIVYLLANELLKPGEPKYAGDKPTKTSLAADNLISRFSTLIKIHQKSNKSSKEQLKTLPREMAQRLLDEVLPKSEAYARGEGPPGTWDEIFTGEFKDLVTREEIVDGIEEKLKEIFYSIDVVKGKQDRAMKRIIVLDQKAGLIDGRGGGLEEMVKTICKSIDETIDEYAHKREKIIEKQPLLVNALAKAAFKDPNVSDVIKKSAHALITICISRMFRTQPGDEAKPGKEAERLLKVMSNLFNAYNPADPKATAIAWLKEFLPEKPTDLLKEIVPPFLQETLTRDFLADLLLEYVEEVKEMVGTLKAAPTDDEEVKKLQKFIRETLEKNKDPKYSRDGLTGFGGFVKSLETAILRTIAGDAEWKSYEKVGKTLENFLNSSVEKVMTGDKMKKLRNKQFLSKAMINALPMFGKVDVNKDLPGYPTLNPNQLVDLSPAGLKKMGFDLERFPGEEDGPFKQRLINKYFEQQCGKLASELAFPNGAEDLPIPKVAKPAAFSKVQEAIGGQIGRIVNRNERILFAIDFFGVEEKEKKEFYALEDHVKATGKLTGKEEKSAEKLFKKGFSTFAMKKIEENVAVGWPNPFRWLAVKFTQAIVAVSLKLGINRQVWNFVSNEKNDEKLRFAIWNFLSFAKRYEPEKKDSEKKDEEKLSTELTKRFKDGLKDMELLRGIRSSAASGIAGFLMGKNFVDLVA